MASSSGCGEGEREGAANSVLVNELKELIAAVAAACGLPYTNGHPRPLSSLSSAGRTDGIGGDQVNGLLLLLGALGTIDSAAGLIWLMRGK
jgi:hypothetical protein